jgi:hypothetical protein
MASKLAKRAARYLADTADVDMRRAARVAGAVSLRAIAAHLNDAGATTARGSTWTAAAAQRVLRRLPARHK